MLVELLGGPYDGNVVDTSAAEPEPTLDLPMGIEITLRPWKAQVYVDPDVPRAHYRFVTVPSPDVGARFVYRYQRTF